jgi:hypothetical protein
MVLNRIKRALEKMMSFQRHLPSSTFGKAISYTLSHWELLTKYVANGRIEPERSAGSQPQATQRASAARQIDNNGVKNAIRPTAIGNVFRRRRRGKAQCRDLHHHRKLPKTRHRST